MDIQETDVNFEAHIKQIYPDLPDAWYKRDEKGRYPQGMQQDWELWQAAKAQAVPNTQALHDRLLVKSIREHVESHISEISVNDLFDKGWLAAMKCIQNNIDMLEAQEPAND